jgi:predicted transcriptional regulator of viral defense system
MSVKDYFATHPVFRRDEFDEYKKNNSHWTRKNLLAHYCRQGRLRLVRRGLYAVVPYGVDSQNFRVDPYLLAFKSANDAFLSFHTALEVFGKSYSVFQRYSYGSIRAFHPFELDGCSYESTSIPKALIEAEQPYFAVKTIERDGLDVRVSTLERTLVDLLDRPNLGGGWEEIYRSLESVEYFDLDMVVEYVHLLGKKTTAAKVGYYLQQHAEELMVEDSHLKELRKLCPKHAFYLERGGSGVVVRDWNLVVPQWIAERSWDSVI